MKQFWRTGGLALLVALFLLASQVMASDVVRTTCKVTTSGHATSAEKCATYSAGTGFAFHQDGSLIYVMTNAHVVGRSTRPGTIVWTTWYKDGHKSAKLPMTVVGVSGKYDVAIGCIDEAVFEGHPPIIIPLGPVEDLSPDQVIQTVGCPSADWPTKAEGRIIKPLIHEATNQQTGFLYTPAPRNGRSGSPIFNADGTAVLGLCYSRTTFNGQTRGNAFSTLVLRSLFPSGSVEQAIAPPQSADEMELAAYTGTDGELQPGLPVATMTADGEAGHLLPWRKNHCQGACKRRPQQPPQKATGGGAWPTLNPPQQAAIMQQADGFPVMMLIVAIIVTALLTVGVHYKRRFFG